MVKLVHSGTHSAVRRLKRLATVKASSERRIMRLAPLGRELIVEAAIRNLANMIANNRWLDTPEKVEAYCNHIGMDLANYALGMREEA